MIAEIIVDVLSSQVDKVFDYNIPCSFDYLTEGYRVLVPFGNRMIEGYVLSIKKTTDCPPDKLKSIFQVCDKTPLILPEIIELIKYMKDKLYLRLLDGIRLAIPSQVKFGDYKFDTTAVLDDDKVQGYLATLSKRQKNIPLLIEYLENTGKSKLSVLNSKFGSANVKKLIENGVIVVSKSKINRLAKAKKTQNDIKLTDLQKSCVKDILKSTDKPIVLFGVTGSGKTNRKCACQGQNSSYACSGDISNSSNG